MAEKKKKKEHLRATSFSDLPKLKKGLLSKKTRTVGLKRSTSESVSEPILSSSSPPPTTISITPTTTTPIMIHSSQDITSVQLEQMIAQLKKIHLGQTDIILKMQQLHDQNITLSKKISNMTPKTIVLVIESGDDMIKFMQYYTQSKSEVQ